MDGWMDRYHTCYICFILPLSIVTFFNIRIMFSIYSSYSSKIKWILLLG